MVQNSEEIWNEILSNQSRELIGTNEPNNGNGYHDGISWRIPFRPQMKFDDEFRRSPFYSIYLRDLGLRADPSLSKKGEFETGLRIGNCSKNFSKSLFKFFVKAYQLKQYKPSFHWFPCLLHSLCSVCGTS